MKFVEFISSIFCQCIDYSRSGVPNMTGFIGYRGAPPTLPDGDKWYLHFRLYKEGDVPQRLDWVVILKL